MTLLLAKTTAKQKACRYYGIVVKDDMFKTDLPTKLESTKGCKAMQLISIKDAFNRARFD